MTEYWVSLHPHYTIFKAGGETKHNAKRGVNIYVLLSTSISSIGHYHFFQKKIHKDRTYVVKKKKKDNKHTIPK